MKGLIEVFLIFTLFGLQTSLGSLLLLMMVEITGGRWAVPLIENWRKMAKCLPIFGVFLIPVFFNLEKIYPWVGLKTANAPYLNEEFFITRSIFYFLIWLLLSFFYLKKPSYRLSCLGIILLFFTLSFASIDWVMSLEPTWHSTIFGLIFIVSSSLIALALSVFFVDISEVSAPQLVDLGNVFLAFIMVWAYLSFVQYLIIWIGNIPGEAPWFIHRTQGIWRVFSEVLIIFQFALPFFLLLFRPLKKIPLFLKTISLLLCVTTTIHTLWLVVPSISKAHL